MIEMGFDMNATNASGLMPLHQIFMSNYKTGYTVEQVREIAHKLKFISSADKKQPFNFDYFIDFLGDNATIYGQSDLGTCALLQLSRRY